jgi:cytochrome c peroxidase
MLSDAQRGVRHRYADEVLYAIGMYLMSLEPPRNPNPASADMLARGQAVFEREQCGACHAPPSYTTGKLTLAQGWTPPADHPLRDDLMMRSVGTDPGTALMTRKGTGMYKIPTLRGVWYRQLFLHDGAVASLEELFDPARLAADYVSKGWNPPPGARHGVPGHIFGLKLGPDDKAALIAFLRAL